MILFSIKHILRLIMYEEMTRQLSKQYIFESLEHVTIKRSYNLQFFFPFKCVGSLFERCYNMEKLYGFCLVFLLICYCQTA